MKKAKNILVSFIFSLVILSSPSNGVFEYYSHLKYNIEYIDCGTENLSIGTTEFSSETEDSYITPASLGFINNFRCTNLFSIDKTTAVKKVNPVWQPPKIS
jgi:hypothetical protein